MRRHELGIIAFHQSYRFTTIIHFTIFIIIILTSGSKEHHYKLVSNQEATVICKTSSFIATEIATSTTSSYEYAKFLPLYDWNGLAMLHLCWRRHARWISIRVRFNLVNIIFLFLTPLSSWLPSSFVLNAEVVLLDFLPSLHSTKTWVHSSMLYRSGTTKERWIRPSILFRRVHLKWMNLGTVTTYRVLQR